LVAWCNNRISLRGPKYGESQIPDILHICRSEEIQHRPTAPLIGEEIPDPAPVLPPPCLLPHLKYLICLSWNCRRYLNSSIFSLPSHQRPAAQSYDVPADSMFQLLLGLSSLLPCHHTCSTPSPAATRLHSRMLYADLMREMLLAVSQ